MDLRAIILGVFIKDQKKIDGIIENINIYFPIVAAIISIVFFMLFVAYFNYKWSIMTEAIVRSYCK